ncbi:MAG TPA: universal stress protein [Aliidongia sp.]|nr:universal stress protein [Aliidongia sp.]
MAIRTILVPTWQGADPAMALDTAEAFARALESWLELVFIRSNPNAVVSMVPELVPVTKFEFEAIDREGRAAAAKSRTEFEAWTRERELVPAEPGDNAVGPVGSWVEEIGEVAAAIEHRGRLSDMLVLSLGQTDDYMSARAVEAALFGTGRPVVLVREKLAAPPLQHVMIAWNGTLEASQAVSQSYDLLRRAERVSIVGEPPNIDARHELAQYIRRQGLMPDTELEIVPAASTGASLLATAQKAGVTLMVRGAYTHGRLRQTLLGGITRDVLEQARLPIFMMH